EAENSIHIRQQINTATEKRCLALQTQLTKMINSILNRHTDHISFQNFKTDTDLITDPNSIKEQVKNYFDQWTEYRPIDQQIFDSTWKSCYKPISSINSSHYDNVLNTITTEEITHTLQNLSNNKACGLSGISYEMLKHAGDLFLQTVTTLLNRCLTSQMIPKQWKICHIFPI